MNIIEKGQLEGDFNGFKDENKTFKFLDGNRWKQDESKYHYHYAFMPEAIVILENDIFYLEVHDIKDRVKVKKVS